MLMHSNSFVDMNFIIRYFRGNIQKAASSEVFLFHLYTQESQMIAVFFLLELSLLI